MQNINIFDFTCYKAYLESIYAHRKKRNSSYSMRKFSQDLGFSGPNYAAVLIEGKRKCNKASIEKVCDSLGLKNIQREYFRLLVQSHFSQGSEKSKIVARALKLNSNLKGFMISDSLGYYLENNACRHITYLLQVYQEEFVADPLWISRKIRINISIEKIRSALNFLIEFGFIKKVDYQYTNSQTNLVTKDEIPSRSIKIAQEHFLNEAIEGLSFGLKEREYGNITVSLHSDLVPKLKLKLKEIRNNLKSWITEKNSSYASDSKESFLAISVNFQMYPIIYTRKNRKKS